MSRSDDIYKPALASKKIPILTLDNKWHKLFTQAEPNKRLKKREEELNELLKKQGKANTEIKEIKKLKRRLMQGIMENASEASSGNDARARKKTDESKRLMGECNQKIAVYEDELLELPRQIDKVNKELMLMTMEICYDRLKENERDIEEITKWVAQVKEELKEKLILKQEKETVNQELYSYMHDIFGADVINLFDTKYKIENPDGGRK
ncbi:MAG: hypothetical protein HFI44_05080 [Lachnospiraceae bacterium]|nr:hypothetical protein [Lachnospiraceae bacterium]GFI02962.1 hypothetical protein IMSAGC005_01793 [Lachnospiraceae bacterium]